MKLRRERVLLCLSLFALNRCVSEEALLGDNVPPAGEAADAGARTIQGAIDDERGPTKFDIAEERVVSPTWRYDFQCDELCARMPDVRVSPDGTVWVALLGGQSFGAPGRTGPVQTDSMFFARLDASGKELANYACPLGAPKSLAEGGSPLLLDEHGQPYALRWPQLANAPYPSARVFRLERDKLQDRSLPGSFNKSDTQYIAGFPDGSFLEFSSQTEARAVRFSDTGETLWKTKELRAVPSSSGSYLTIDGPLYLSDGSIVLDDLRKSDESGGFGLTVLGPDGKVRWDMSYYLGSSPFKQLAAGFDGGLLLAGVRGADEDLQVFSYDKRGELLQSFRGIRTGYQSVAPRAIGVDEHGDIYVALIVGGRDQPKLSACKLSSGIDLTAHCVALDLIDAGEPRGNALAYPFLGVRMVVAAPDALLFALGHKQAGRLVTSIVRLDLATQGSQIQNAP